MKIFYEENCIDHVHMLIQIPSKISVSSFMEYLKDKRRFMIFEKWSNKVFDLFSKINIHNNLNLKVHLMINRVTGE